MARSCDGLLEHGLLSGTVWILFVYPESNIDLFFLTFVLLHPCYYVVNIQLTLLLCHVLRCPIWNLIG